MVYAEIKEVILMNSKLVELLVNNFIEEYVDKTQTYEKYSELLSKFEYRDIEDIEKLSQEIREAELRAFVIYIIPYLEK